MYFDFEDYHPSIEPVGRALTPLEMVLLTIIFHLLMVILVLVSPKWLPKFLPKFLQTVPAPAFALQQPRQEPRFVFVQPRLERPVLKAPDRAEASDLNRRAAAYPGRDDVAMLRGEPVRVHRPETAFAKPAAQQHRKDVRHRVRVARGHGARPHGGYACCCRSATSSQSSRLASSQSSGP